MVEGGKIDWACHANDAAASILNTLAFDEAVKGAVEFATQHPEDTLIVVAGDHECGGLTLGFAGTKYESYFGILKHQSVSFQKFSDEILKASKGLPRRLLNATLLRNAPDRAFWSRSTKKTRPGRVTVQ